MLNANYDEPKKRHKTRIQVKIPVKIYQERATTKEYDAEITNISETGAFIACHSPLKVGEKILVQIKFLETKQFDGVIIPTEKLGTQIPEPIVESSMVLWEEKDKKKDNMGFGIEFAKLQPDKQVFLQKLLRYFDHLSKAGVRFNSP